MSVLKWLSDQAKQINRLQVTDIFSSRQPVSNRIIIEN